MHPKWWAYKGFVYQACAITLLIGDECMETLTLPALFYLEYWRRNSKEFLLIRVNHLCEDILHSYQNKYIIRCTYCSLIQTSCLRNSWKSWFIAVLHNYNKIVFMNRPSSNYKKSGIIRIICPRNVQMLVIQY